MQGCIQLRLQPACIPAGRLTSCCTAWGVLRLLRADVKGLVAQKPNCSGEQSPSRNFRYWTLFASTLGGRMAALPISSQLRSSCHKGLSSYTPLTEKSPLLIAMRMFRLPRASVKRQCASSAECPGAPRTPLMCKFVFSTSLVPRLARQGLVSIAL